jgi:hypothetical protein
LVEKYYDWDKIANRWLDVFTSFPPRPREKSWNAPRNVHNIPTQIPPGMKLDELIRWGVQNIWGNETAVDGYVMTRMLRDLNFNMKQEPLQGLYFNDASFLGQRPRFHPYALQDALNELAQFGQKKNYWEARRIGEIKEPIPDYINKAHEVSI